MLRDGDLGITRGHQLHRTATARIVTLDANAGGSMRCGIVALTLISAVSVVSACGGRGPVPALHEGLHTASAEITVAEAVAAHGGYEPGGVEVMVSRAQLRILINSTHLAEVDSAARAVAAAQAAGTAEKVLESDPEFPSIQSISVAIVHPPQLRAGSLWSHTEEVFEFRRGADSEFRLPHE